MKKFITLLSLTFALFCLTASAQTSGRDAITGNISADSTVTIEWVADKESMIAVEGSFGGGTVTVQYEVIVDSGNYIAFEDMDAATAEFGKQFVSPSNRIQIVVAGSTAPTITYVVRRKSQ